MSNRSSPLQQKAGVAGSKVITDIFLLVQTIWSPPFLVDFHNNSSTSWFSNPESIFQTSVGQITWEAKRAVHQDQYIVSSIFPWTRKSSYQSSSISTAKASWTIYAGRSGSGWEQQWTWTWCPSQVCVTVGWQAAVSTDERPWRPGQTGSHWS